MFSLKTLITIAISAVVSTSLTVAAAQPNVQAKVKQAVVEAQVSLEAAADSFIAETSTNVEAGVTTNGSGDVLLPPSVTIVTNAEANTGAETNSEANASTTTDPSTATSITTDTTLTTDTGADLSVNVGGIVIDAAGQTAVDNQTQVEVSDGGEAASDVLIEESAEGQIGLGTKFIKSLKGHFGSLTGGLFTVTGEAGAEAGP